MLAATACIAFPTPTSASPVGAAGAVVQGPPTNVRITSDTGTSVTISWDHPMVTLQHEPIRGFWVYRSPGSVGAFQVEENHWVDYTERSYTDDNPRSVLLGGGHQGNLVYTVTTVYTDGGGDIWESQPSTPVVRTTV
jgi:hypothetical protein